jgi:endonuclease/exonuclease/phosphatase family metal-dependent hydrolase
MPLCLRVCAALLLQLSISACAGRVAAVAPFPAGGDPGRPPALAVVAWNLDAGRADLTRLVDDLAAGRLTGLPPSEYVLLLQEAIEDDVAALAAARGLHAFVGRVRDNERGGRRRAQGNAIVSTLPLAGTRVIPLPRERQPRAAAFATVTLRGQTLFVVSVHLENRVSVWRGGLISDAARGRQARVLVDALPADAPGVVGGDLNTWLGPEEPAWRLLTGRFPDSPAEASDPTFHERLVLDHVFFDLPAGLTARRGVVRDRYGSNHHPVVGVVTGP